MMTFMDDLMNLLGEVANAFQTRLQGMNALRALKLAPFQARLLTVIGRRPGCSQQELASWTGRDKAQIARTIKELEALGLLDRLTHESDWRSHRLQPTALGEETCNLLLQERAALGAAISKDIRAEERQVVVEALLKMQHRLEHDSNRDEDRIL
jgi:DNA-binding MarR family transcriptional regulator